MTTLRDIAVAVGVTSTSVANTLKRQGNVSESTHLRIPLPVWAETTIFAHHSPLSRFPKRSWLLKHQTVVSFDGWDIRTSALMYD